MPPRMQEAVEEGSACGGMENRWMHAGENFRCCIYVVTTYAIARAAVKVDFVLDLLETHVERLREMSPLWEMVQEGIDLKEIQWSQDAHHH